MAKRHGLSESLLYNWRSSGKETAKTNDLNPEAYLRDILTRITKGHPINPIDELMLCARPDERA